jgi:hypothetical protein
VLAKLRNTIHGRVLPQVRQREILHPESIWVRLQGVTAGYASLDPTDTLLGIEGRKRVRLQLGL